MVATAMAIEANVVTTLENKRFGVLVSTSWCPCPCGQILMACNPTISLTTVQEALFLRGVQLLFAPAGADSKMEIMR